MNILIGIWKDEKGTYYKCTNCGFASPHHMDLAHTLRNSRLHRSHCTRPEKWTDREVNGVPSTLIGIELISL